MFILILFTFLFSRRKLPNNFPNNFFLFPNNFFLDSLMLLVVVCQSRKKENILLLVMLLKGILLSRCSLPKGQGINPNVSVTQSKKSQGPTMIRKQLMRSCTHLPKLMMRSVKNSCPLSKIIEPGILYLVSPLIYFSSFFTNFIGIFFIFHQCTQGVRS